ncbi:MAG: TRAP transporter large permease subunit [Wenzhouxiangellaceae bacterium]
MSAIGPILLFLAIFLALLSGYPVAFTLAGISLIAAGIGSLSGSFDPAFLAAFPNRVFGIMTNETLLAVPLFVFMGVMLERARLAEELLTDAAALFRGVRGGMGLAVVLVGALLAASTGIVGTTVVTMGLLSMPVMLRCGYRPSLASGTICAAGTLGQLIPPSIALVLLGDVLGNAFQQAQLSQGVFSPRTISVGDLFAGALAPGVLLVLLYMAYLLWTGWRQPEACGDELPAVDQQRLWKHLLGLLSGPLLLMLAVLGSILGGIATPTEAAAVGAIGATLLAAVRGCFNFQLLREVAMRSIQISSMVFMILVGASLFSLVFRGFGGDELVRHGLSSLPGGMWGALAVVMVAVFILGFMLDFIEITYVVLPIVGPVLLAMGIDPVWLGILLAINLQTSFLTPPFGFALFYLRGVAPDELRTADLYRGVMPYIMIQIVLLALVIAFPLLATGLPGWLTS